jgi:hypothetical protein
MLACRVPVALEGNPSGKKLRDTLPGDSSEGVSRDVEREVLVTPHFIFGARAADAAAELAGEARLAP